MNLKTNLPMYVYTLVADYCRKAAITRNKSTIIHFKYI